MAIIKKPDAFYMLFASVRVMRAAFSDAYKRVRSYSYSYTESEMTDEQRAAFENAFRALDEAVKRMDAAIQTVDETFRSVR